MQRPDPFQAVAAAATVVAIALAALVTPIAALPLRHTHAPGIGLHSHGPAVGGPKGADRVQGRYLGPTRPPSTPTPGIPCDDGSMPEKVQGKAPLADYESGRAAKGYFCNARQVANLGNSGGYRVERYVDKAGNECAFWDSTLLWPHNVPNQGAEGPGAYVLDMKNPSKPVVTDILRTPAMQSPHESLRLNTKRGLLVADMGYPTWMPGFVDVYDVKENCLQPTLLSSVPIGVIGHEGGFAPDGKTFYVASLYGHTLTAVDLTNPQAPVVVWTSSEYQPHGVSVSNDGNRLYIAESAFQDGNDFTGLTILDVSEVQDRVPNPTVPLVSRLTWPELSTPQNATPFTRNGHEYLLETDEFGSGKNIGAGRIIDISNEKKPFVVSNLRLAVNKGDQTEDPGDDQPFQGYQGHYCSLPSRVDPYIVACSFIMSGLRVFDISDVKHPKEIAYFNKVQMPGTNFYPSKAGAFAMSAPAYDEATGDIWYTDGHTGFYVVRLTGAAARNKFAARILHPGN
ncbi:MAG: LVIVD repeat-containing protein [Actinomycetota bacterium]